MTLEEFLDKLDGVRAAGNGYVAECPAHDDHEASLGVTADEEKLLVRCYAGCDTGTVMEKLGLKLSDLFFNNLVSGGAPEAIYPYTDEVGEVLFEAVRFPGKRFRQRHRDPLNERADDEGFVWNLDGVRRVLFRLPEVRMAISEGKSIYLVEGEKDALRLWNEGFAATCNPMGAGKWRPEYTPQLAGAKVVRIIQDKDDPGRRHAERVKEQLEAAGIPVEVWQAKTGKDISDHFDAGHAISDLVKPRAILRKGIVTAHELVAQGNEYIQLRESDLPGWELIPGVPATIVRPGRMYAWGAYTGDGKTTIALQGTRNIASQYVRVGYCTTEMTPNDLRNKLLAHMGIPLWLLEHPWELKQNPEMYQLYQLGLEQIESWHLDVVFDSAMTAAKVIGNCVDREWDFVVLDHVHRMGWGDRRNFEQQIQELTNMTLDYNVAFLMLCQLRRFQRGKDMVAYPPPILQDFRETEMIGMDASIAAAVWRQRDADGLRYEGDTTQFRVLKNRHTTGRRDQTGHVELLNFDRTTGMYTVGQMVAPQQVFDTAPPEPDDEDDIDPWEEWSA